MQTSDTSVQHKISRRLARRWARAQPGMARQLWPITPLARSRMSRVVRASSNWALTLDSECRTEVPDHPCAVRKRTPSAPHGSLQPPISGIVSPRSEEGRGGEEGRSRWVADHL